MLWWVILGYTNPKGILLGSSTRNEIIHDSIQSSGDGPLPGEWFLPNQSLKKPVKYSSWCKLTFYCVASRSDLTPPVRCISTHLKKWLVQHQQHRKCKFPRKLRLGKINVAKIHSKFCFICSTDTCSELASQCLFEQLFFFL